MLKVVFLCVDFDKFYRLKERIGVVDSLVLVIKDSLLAALN